MAKLYDLTENYLSFVAEVETYDLDAQCLLDTLEGSSQLMNIEEKANNIIKMAKNWESDIAGYEAEIKRLTERKKVIENRVEGVKNFLFSQLEYAGLTEVKTSIATVKQVSNPPSVLVADETAIPAKYQTIVPASYKISKTDIAKDLKAGLEVPGATLQTSKRWKIS